MKALQGKTVVITGASRGIGKAIALKCAAEGAHVVVASKSIKPHPKLEGTIPQTVKEIEALGAQALGVKLDVRNANSINQMVEQTVERFSGIDILINNAGAISLTNLENTSAKLHERMHQVNERALFLTCQAALPWLKKSKNAHILNLSPPLSLNPKWLKNHIPYTASKYAMSLYTLGLAEELKSVGIAVNSLWPKTIISTAAIEFAVGDKSMLELGRKPDIMADAALEIICKERLELTGQLLIDEDVLRKCGVEHFEKYAYDVANNHKLMKDLFVE